MNQRTSDAVATQVMQPPTAQAIEEALRKLPGVMCASVAMQNDASISEVHLVSSYAKRPKALVRDTESLLHAQFHVRVDYRCISVVQIQTEDDTPLTRRSLRFESAGPCDGNQGLVEVNLTLEGRRFRGAVPALADTDQARAMAAGQATLQAVQWAHRLDLPLMVQEAHIVPSACYPVCVSIVEAGTKHGQELLTGTCFVVRDVFEAGTKAVLDAINRRVTFWVRAQTLAQGG